MIDLIVSADSHVMEPVDLWKKGVPEKYREAAPLFPPHKLGEGFQQRAGGQANRKVIDLGPGQWAIIETQVVELAFVRGADILVTDREGSRGLKTAGQMIAKYF